ncbi:hypothetical protein V6N12_056448 [Hibiscus sabdariffa]|uniref:THH1/TOM1/TOM3 domain-containing protein n=1 Tax=Hibiscus sabdariffa TaxID=183260 RepID=A0ABR2CT05_9ROSI
MEEGNGVGAAAIVIKLKTASNWWRGINDSPLWQDRIFHILAALFGLVSAVALIVQHIFLDMPSLVFFTTYALLILFWAEIYYQARAVSTDGLRPCFFSINAEVYTIQIAIWLVLWWKFIPVLVILSKMFFAGVSLFAALVFLLYGGRLFIMLQRFPVESKGRHKKLQEVGYVTTICFSCFLVRCIMVDPSFPFLLY